MIAFEIHNLKINFVHKKGRKNKSGEKMKSLIETIYERFQYLSFYVIINEVFYRCEKYLPNGYSWERLENVPEDVTEKIVIKYG